jgi:hypothetical protein
MVDNSSKSWIDEQREFYAFVVFDQAKQGTKAARPGRPAPIRTQSARKNILLSPAPQDFHQSSTGFPHPPSRLTPTNRHTTLKRSMNNKCLWLLALVIAAGARLAAVDSVDNVTLFRVFLTDGTAVVSYGEYARVGDRVVFSMPIGVVNARSSGLNLHVVNIPATAVDWTATSKYAESARFAHYIATNAESDYAALTGEVAGVLNSVAFTKDPKARLNLAIQARRRLASWPRDHFGYRADDVRQILGLLDETISAMRAAAGETEFSLDLVADFEAPKPAPVMPDPAPAESIAQALAVAKVSDVAADRVSLLRSAVAAIDDPRNAAPRAWAKSTRRRAVWMIGQETRTDALYAQLVSTMLKRGTEAAAAADVRSVEKVIDAVQHHDAQLGAHRPDAINGLLTELHLRLDAARNLRLARDRWKERLGSFRAYRRAVDPVIAVLDHAQNPLDDIKRLAGSEAGTLVSLADRFADSSKRLSAVSVPDELKPAHALLVSALNFADTAVKVRRQAVVSGDLKAAWDASSAAAGSMMMFARAKEDMEATVELPRIR